MRQHSIAVRALVSSAAVVLLVLIASLPARIGAQAEVALTVTPERASGDPGTRVVYQFTITNNSDSDRSFNITVTGSTFTTDFASPVPVPGGGSSRTFEVGFTIPTNATPGASDDATISVTSPATGGEPTLSASRTVITTVTINGNTVTPTGTGTTTRTPTSTTGPSPTSGPVCRDNDEPDDTPAQANELQPDLGETHVMCPTGDQDWLYFGGIAGKVFTIDVSAMSDGLDLTLSLYDEAGNLLAFNDDFPRNNDASDIRPRIQSWRVPANGRYFIRVRDAAGGGGTNLAYSIFLITESYGPTPTLIAELCTDLFEPDGVPEQARLAGIREVQPNHRLCPAGDSDWIRFFGKAGGSYALRTDSRARAGVDTVMVLVDRDGVSIIDFNDDSGGTLDSRIEFTPTVDGFYFVQIKNVGDLGNQFIVYDFFFEPLGVSGPAPTTPAGTNRTPTATTRTTVGTPTRTVTGTPATATRTTGTATTNPNGICPTAQPEEGYPPGCPDATGLDRIGGPKGQPEFVNGPANDFVDPAFQGVWSRTDQVVAAQQATRTWMWGPAGLVGRAEVYQQTNGGARQVQYFDKARMEITDWQRDRANPWFVTNGLLVREMVEGRLQIGDTTFLDREPALIGIAGDADDRAGPTYASFAAHLGSVPDRVGQTAALLLRRDGTTATAEERPEARLQAYVPETGHNIAQVFWDFLHARGPVEDGAREDTLVDWVFAMGYPISEPFWTRVKVGGVEKDVLVQAFQRRVLTYTPSNPVGWQVEMGNVGRHYYIWRYGRQP